MPAFDDKQIGLIFKTLRFAAEKHRSHRRKNAEASPYINHLIEVADLLWDVGRVRDLHLIFPGHEDRLRPLAIEESIDLGGREFVCVEPVIFDLTSTRWGFDSGRRVLFCGDGFAYSHYHEDGHCGKVAEESPSLDLPEMTALFAELALYWTRFVDLEPYIARLDGLLLDELAVELVAPTHGLPITDLAATMPSIRDGLRLGSSGGR